MNRWQHFYDLAATQLAVQFAGLRNFDAAEKAAAATRMATEAKVFADAFRAAEDAAFEPQQAERVAVVIGAEFEYGLGGRVTSKHPLEVPAGVTPVRIDAPKPFVGESIVEIPPRVNPDTGPLNVRYGMDPGGTLSTGLIGDSAELKT